jgi:hypothetical protein
MDVGFAMRRLDLRAREGLEDEIVDHRRDRR